MTRLPVAILSLGAALTVSGAAQTPLPRPVISAPTVIVGPSSLAAWSDSRAKVSLSWPAVVGAERYRLTRIDNTGTPEVPILELLATSFTFEGSNCLAGSGFPNCVYVDVSKLSRATHIVGNTYDPADVITTPSGWISPHSVASGALYSYRAWAVFPGPVISPPSPPATVKVK